MATWGELSKFTYGELKIFTYDQLGRLTIDELTAIANSKIDSISIKQSEFATGLKSILSVILLNMVSSAAYDVAKDIDWLLVLKKFILFLQSF